MLSLWLIFIIVIISFVQVNTEKRKIVFIILSQDVDYYDKKAENLKNDILTKSSQFIEPIVYLSHKDFKDKGIGHWIVFPLIPELVENHGNDSKCYIFCTESTRFNMKNLEQNFKKYDFSKELFIGHALKDTEPTIIHHFAGFKDDEFSFPNFAIGFIISTPLLKRIDGILNYSRGIEFSIDASHEFALVIYNFFHLILTNETSFCIDKNEQCSTWVEKFEPCNGLGSLDSIYFGVKTCGKFHQKRVPIVKDTWAKFAQNIEYFSDKYDESIPTVDLKIKNTNIGHCAKTIALLHHVAKKMEENSEILWLAIVDDDTIISTSLLADYLTCFNPHEKLLIGERYGYRVFSQKNRGYNYITGGGGMILSRELVKSLVEKESCKCPSINSADDMFLALCVANISGKIIHSPKFHQARPPDYSVNYLLTHGAISFHKHWEIEPYKVYEKWFASHDKKIYEQRSYFEYIIKKIINMFLCYLNMCKLYFYN